MGAVALTGADTIQIDSRVLTDLADGDAVRLEFSDEIAVAKPGKNGNVIYAFNEMGRRVDCVVRVLLGSADDKYLNSRLQAMKNDFSQFTLASGSFSKRVGNGSGVISTVVYQCSGGVFKRQVNAKTSSEGDTEQSVAEYTITYGNGDRSIQ